MNYCGEIDLIRTLLDRNNSIVSSETWLCDLDKSNGKACFFFLIVFSSVMRKEVIVEITTSLSSVLLCTGLNLVLWDSCLRSVRKQWSYFSFAVLFIVIIFIGFFCVKNKSTTAWHWEASRTGPQGTCWSQGWLNRSSLFLISIILSFLSLYWEPLKSSYVYMGTCNIDCTNDTAISVWNLKWFLFLFFFKEKPGPCTDLLLDVVCTWADELHNSLAYYRESKAWLRNAGIMWICNNMAPYCIRSCSYPRATLDGFVDRAVGLILRGQLCHSLCNYENRSHC